MAEARTRPGGTEVLALLPGVRHDRVEEVLGPRVRWCQGTGEFLEALQAADWELLLLSFDHEAVDEALARRMLEVRADIPLFLTSSEASIDRVLSAERAGAVSLLSHPPSEESLRAEVDLPP